MPSSALPDQIAELMAVADSLPIGLARLSVREEAVQVADALRDTAAGFQTRRVLIDEAAYCLRYDLYAVAFSWCLSAARDDPARFSLVDLLGHYQHLIGKMVNFPNVSREQYESLFADVVREFRERGFTLRMVYLQRRDVAIDFGDREMAAAADREWRKHPRDEMSSSVEAEMALQMQHACFMEDEPAAVRVADQFFARGKREQLFDSWLSSLALLPLLRTGREADAAARYRIASRDTHHVGYVWSRGNHMEYLALIGDFARGIREFEAQLPAAMDQPDPLSHYCFLRPAALLFDRIAANGTRKVTMKAPPIMPWHDQRGVYDVSQVRAWLQSEATAIASQFDERNGNPYYSEWLRRTIEQVDRRPS